MPDSPHDVTAILSAIGCGRADVADDLLPLVYDELRRLAAALMGQERSDHTLQATSLVNEAYLRLVGSDGPKWADRRYFFAAAGQAMRRVLVEHARRHHAQANLESSVNLIDASDDEGATIDWEALDLALLQLTREDHRLVDVVHMRYFAGMTQADTSAALGVSESTVKRDWAYARARLRQILNGEPE